ncbi:hypothetical protein [Nonomuraea jiangxiensis]|uniref:Uncharacterized protein n=1 Tax=Nonomuraea jiangxiensis TaxID=633440 RepID=A0A1G9MT54_9ACTN|nr:hypothetical protein [Nonomuraea jiangxiensis]SDL77420.1 hypothetical protein SAMN05421869_130109 [Nonomuraea jiangxiensis]
MPVSNRNAEPQVSPTGRVSGTHGVISRTVGHAGQSFLAQQVPPIGRPVDQCDEESAVAETFRGRAQGARLALIDGAAGAVWSAGGQPRMAFDFTIAAGRITEINLIADLDHLRELHLEVIED